jgi:hypothetical protein
MGRHRFDPLADTRRPHWLTVSDLHRNLITCQALASGADLRIALREVLAQCAAEGWQAENDGAYGFMFIARGSERRLVNLTPADPSDSTGTGHAFLAGQAGKLGAPELEHY